jgi:hypothetical protein
MTYHTNHITCLNSNWDGNIFNAITIVYFDNKITKTDMLEDNENNECEKLIKIENPDFKNLIETTSEGFYEINTLKKEVIDWLNLNIKDIKNESEKNINAIKGWCVENKEGLKLNCGEVKIYFKRQEDALRFIRKWSIFKEPLFYFDYLSDDRRNMDLNKIIYILNNYLEEKGLRKIEKEDIKLNNKFQGNINLDPLTFTFNYIDFDNIEEKEEVVKYLYENNNIIYEENDLYNNYIKQFELIHNNEISISYDYEEYIK